MHDVNVSPDKRSILLHNEANLVSALKDALEQKFTSARSTFTVSNFNAASSSNSSLHSRTQKKAQPSEGSEDAQEKAVHKEQQDTPDNNRNLLGFRIDHTWNLDG